VCRVSGRSSAGGTAERDPAPVVPISAYHRNTRLRQRYPAPDAQMSGKARHCIQFPGRHSHHGICPQRAGCDHLSGTGDAGIRLPRRGVPPIGACLLPDTGVGVLQNGKFCGEPDIAEVFARAEGIKIPGTLGCPVFFKKFRYTCFGEAEMRCDHLPKYHKSEFEYRFDLECRTKCFHSRPLEWYHFR